MSKIQKSILVVEDDDLYRDAVVDILSSKYSILIADSVNKAQEVVQQQTPDLIFVDIRLPDGNGVELIKKIRTVCANSAIVVMTAVEDINIVVEAMRNGADDYLVKPVKSDFLRMVVEKSLATRDIKHELEHRRHADAKSSPEIIGNSPVMSQLIKEVGVVGQSDTTVLIEGETGTGKELIARLVHRRSARFLKPFIALNCAAIPKDLVEAELFGYREGAFTGATKQGIGKFELADNGTLLLDEIAEVPLEVQAKLLRFIEEQEFYPVGSSGLRRVDTRIIAATNKDLREMVRNNLFRDDLYYRLNVCTLSAPPLRERGDDIMQLAEYFVEQFNRKFGKAVTRFHPRARAILLEHKWPGNVRELRNILERVMLFCDDGQIGPERLRFIQADGHEKAAARKIIKSDADAGLDQRLTEIEKTMIMDALERSQWNKTKAAKRLKLSVPTFHYRLEKYGIK